MGFSMVRVKSGRKEVKREKEEKKITDKARTLTIHLFINSLC